MRNKHLTMIVKLAELENIDTGACLQGLTPGYERVRIFLDDRNILRIGRGENVDLCLNNPAISGLHCVLLRNEDNSYSILDTSSHNGSYVNSVDIREARLEDGDSIWIGTLEFKYTSGGCEGLSENDSFFIDSGNSKRLKLNNYIFWSAISLSTLAVGLTTYLLLNL